MEYREMMITITLDEYRRLLKAADRLEMLTMDIIANIETGAASYDIVNEELVRYVTDTAHCTKAAEEETHE